MADVYDQRVASGAEDGTWATTGSHWWARDSTYLWMGPNQIGFFRFQNLPMEQGVTIDSAYFKIWTHEYGGGNPVYLKIKAVDEDNTAAFPAQGYSSDPGTRPLTTAGVDFDIPSWTYNTLKTSADIKSVIQEVVDRPGWAGGNALAIAIIDDGGTYTSDFWPYEYGSAKAAELIITYTGISTYKKTIVAAANVINPTLDYGIVVAKPTFDAIADKDPSHHIFNSDYPTLKYYASGSLQIDLDTDDLAGVVSIEHNLGYIPFVEAYAQTTVGGVYQYAPYSGAGATVFYGVTFRITATHIYFYAESTGFASPTSFYVKYFIFRNDLDV